MFSKKIICLGIYASQFVLFSSQAATDPAQAVEQWVPAQDEPFVAKRPQTLNRSLVADAKLSEIKAEGVVKSPDLPLIDTAESQLQYWSKRGRPDIVEHLRKRHRDNAHAGESRLAQATVVAAGITQPTKPTEPAKVEPYVAAQPMAEAAKPVSVNVRPVKSEPVKTEQLRAEPAKAVNVNAAPIKAEPVKSEVVKTEPVKTEQLRAEPAKAVNVNAAPIKAEPVKSEAVKSEPVNTEQLRAEPAKPVNVNAAAIKTEPVKSEAVKSEPVNTEQLRAEHAKTVNVNAAPIKAEPVKSEAVKSESVKLEPVKLEPVKTELRAEPAKPVSVNAAPIKAEPGKVAQVNPIEPVAALLSNLPPRGEVKSTAYAVAQVNSVPIALAIKEANNVPRPAAELIKVQPLTPTREEQARYWAARGRSDLAVVEPLSRQSGAGGVGRAETVAKASLPLAMNDASAVDALAVVDKKSIDKSNGYNKPETLESRVEPKLNPDEQAKYWAARGRDDLAEQAKTQSEQSDTPFKGGIRTSRADVQLKNAAPGRLLTGDVSSDSDTPLPKLNPDEQAKYWAARGRDDLADQAKSGGEQSGVPVKGIEASRTLRANQRDEKVLVRGVERGASFAQPASQELNGDAEYWAARGRDDLADALKLRMAVARRDSVRVLPAAQTVTQNKSNQRENKSALEDALLKNPSGIKARLDLADIYRQTGELERASVLIDGVLAGNPDLAEALYARARLYAEQSLWREVLWVLEKVSPASRNGEMAKLQKTAWAHVQIDRADVLVRQGDHLEAQVLLRQVARELALNTKQRMQPESPALWKNGVKTKGMR
ncbi:MAG: tetratricopeptide repeat protein [Gallionella sp.]|jgi:tetratricopeptide (TPR) repeat protein